MSKFKHLLLIMTDWGKSYLGWMHFTNFKLDRFQVSQSWPRFQICHLLNHLREDELESRHLVEVRDVVLKDKVIVWKIISLKWAEFFTLQIFSDKVSFHLSVAWLLPVVERLYDGDLDVVFRGYDTQAKRNFSKMYLLIFKRFRWLRVLPFSQMKLVFKCNFSSRYKVAIGLLGFVVWY